MQLKPDYSSMSREDVKIFRDWLMKQRHLPHDVEDHYIASFITGAKGSIERAKKVFDQFYRVQQTMPEIFRDWDLLSEERERFSKLVCTVALPKKTEEGYTVVMSRLLDPDPKDYNNIDMFVSFFIIIQILLWENNVGNGEFVFVIDATDVTFSHLRDLNPVMAKKLMDCIVFASPVRIKGIHLVNLQPMFEWAVSLFKQLMPDKLVNRLHTHPNYDNLKKFVPEEILPVECGGLEGSIIELYANYRARLAGFREKCLKEKILRQEELKYRPTKTCENNNELTGTFRKLCID